MRDIVYTQRQKRQFGMVRDALGLDWRTATDADVAAWVREAKEALAALGPAQDALRENQGLLAQRDAELAAMAERLQEIQTLTDRVQLLESELGKHRMSGVAVYAKEDATGAAPDLS